MATDTVVQVWCESRSLAGVLAGVCRDYRVNLYPAGGGCSITFVNEGAGHVRDLKRSNAIALYVGDYDQAGECIDKAIHREFETRLLKTGADCSLDFRRLAVNEDQIDAMGLPTRAPKPTDKRSKHVTRVVEAEAIPAPTMRAIVREAIAELIPADLLAAERQEEESQRAEVRQRLNETFNGHTS